MASGQRDQLMDASVVRPLRSALHFTQQVDSAWEEVAQPFVAQHSQHFGAAESDWRRCFEWATAIVAAYSFELGDDKYQVRVQFVTS